MCSSMTGSMTDIISGNPMVVKMIVSFNRLTSALSCDGYIVVLSVNDLKRTCGQTLLCVFKIIIVIIITQER